ncbi:MAG: phosphatidylinositol mannoside acyltransferase, partial [Acidimicrobiia bacterium]|nr:phosphatidylinositol mannoside acyltransferase [Acidimicrobiia bacterium]
AVQDLEVTAVVEPLEPPELFDWFVSFREALGMHIVSLEEPGIGSTLVNAINDAHVVCLLSDRLVGGAGVEVEFFGERTKLPAGPATLALRTGAAMLPVGVYQRTKGTHAWCRPPVPAEREGKLRADVQRVTQALAHELEILIRAAPEQWHLMQPNWPSDPGYPANKGK